MLLSVYCPAGHSCIVGAAVGSAGAWLLCVSGDALFLFAPLWKKSFKCLFLVIGRGVGSLLCFGFIHSNFFGVASVAAVDALTP